MYFFVCQMYYIVKIDKEKMMSKSTIIQARVEPQLKIQVESVFEELGMNMSTAVTMFLKQVVLHQGLPFSVNIPNAETIEALKQAHSNIGKPAQYKSKEEFFENLLDGTHI